MDRPDQISLPQAAEFIINLAPTGMIPTRAMTRHVPINHNEIVDDVGRCLELGVQMVHLHARDSQENHSSDPEQYGRLIESIRNLPGGKELVIGVTTSGRSDPSFETRSRVLELDGDMKPDMASLTTSSLNFAKSASVNCPSVIQALAAQMAEVGIRPEIEIFDLGMVNYAAMLSNKGFIKGPVYANILFGNISTAQTSIGQVAAMINSVPSDWVIATAGIGRAQMAANMLGIMYLAGARVGLEDNIWFDNARTKLATNYELVKRLIGWAAEFGRDLAERDAVRRRLQLAS